MSPVECPQVPGSTAAAAELAAQPQGLGKMGEMGEMGENAENWGGMGGKGGKWGEMEKSREL